MNTDNFFAAWRAWREANQHAILCKRMTNDAVIQALPGSIAFWRKQLDSYHSARREAWQRLSGLAQTAREDQA